MTEGAGEEAHKRGAYPAGDSYRGEDPPGTRCGDEAEVQCAGAGLPGGGLAQVAEHDGEEKHEEAAHEERRVNAAVRWGPEGEHHSFEARYEGPALEQDGYFLAPVSNALDFARAESPEGNLLPVASAMEASQPPYFAGRDPALEVGTPERRTRGTGGRPPRRRRPRRKRRARSKALSSSCAELGLLSLEEGPLAVELGELAFQGCRKLGGPPWKSEENWLGEKPRG